MSNSVTCVSSHGVTEEFWLFLISYFSVSWNRTNNVSDPLVTLASAAVSSAPVTTPRTSDAGVGMNSDIKEDIKPDVKSDKMLVKRDQQQWFDVGFIKSTSCTVSHYHLPSENSQGNTDVSLHSSSHLWYSAKYVFHLKTRREDVHIYHWPAQFMIFLSASVSRC